MNTPTTALEEIFRDMNPWWTLGSVPSHITGLPREKYLKQLISSLDAPEIAIITGMRRTGKTTIMYQLIQHLIENDLDPKNVLYVQFDHPMLKDVDVSSMLRNHREAFGISKKEELYLFFDEVHYLQDWASWVKSIYDMGKVKLSISGSSKTLLLPEAMTHLTGRYSITNVWPLDFSEFIFFRNAKPEPGDEHRYVSLAEDYLSTGGFPRVVLEDKAELRIQLLKDYFDSIVFKDIAVVHQVRDIRTLQELAAFIIFSSGKPTSLNKLKNTFRLSLDTIREYISHLEESHLVEGVSIASRSMNERIYNPKKYYVLDPGMRAALTGMKEIGPRVETAVYLHLRQLGLTLGYWKRIHEVDFILDAKPPIAIECKYKSDIKPKDLRSLGKWMDGVKGGRSFIITKNLDERLSSAEGTVMAIPLWKFLLDPGIVLGS